MPRIVVCLLAGFFALPLCAATELDFVCTNDSTVPYTFTGTATIEGRDVRYDIKSGAHPLFNPKLTIISKDAGDRLLIIDHDHKTWFMRKTMAMSGPLSTWRAPGQAWIQRPSVSVKRIGAGETIAGHATTRYDLDAHYTIRMEIEGEKLAAKVTADATLFFADDMKGDATPFGLQFATKAGADTLDRRIAKQLAKKGLAVRQIVKVTRTIEGGAPITETLTVDVTEMREAEAARSQFEPPDGYQYREPAFGFGN